MLRPSMRLSKLRKPLVSIRSFFFRSVSLGAPCLNTLPTNVELGNAQHGVEVSYYVNLLRTFVDFWHARALQGTK
jgi:hypothetical protein